MPKTEPKVVSYNGVTASFDEKRISGPVLISDGINSIEASMTLLKFVLAEVVISQKRAELESADCNDLLGIKWRLT